MVLRLNKMFSSIIYSELTLQTHLLSIKCQKKAFRNTHLSLKHMLIYDKDLILTNFMIVMIMYLTNLVSAITIAQDLNILQNRPNIGRNCSFL